MKRITLILVFYIVSPLAWAQTDSLNLVNAKWSVQKISSKVKLKQFWFNKTLFNSNQNISILEVRPGRKYFFELGFEKQQLRTTSDFGRSAGAISAINGTFFDVKNGGSVDLIKANGQLINENRLGKNGERAVHQQAAILFKNGKITIAKWDGNPTWENILYADKIMVSGPLLILNKQTELLDTANTFNKTRHPRSALAVTKNNRILLITVDGRNENAAGMSMFELANLMRWLNSRDGINLDGGGSTTLWVNGNSNPEVVNFPSDNKKWDHEGERKVANVILLKSK